MDMHFPIRVPDKLNSSKFGKSKYERALSNIDIWVGKFLDSIDHDETLVIITADHGAYIKFLETNNKTFDFEEVASKEITKKNITKKIPKFLKPVKDNFFYRNEIKKNIERKKYLEKNNLSSSKIRELSAGKFEIDHTLFDPKLKTPLLFVNNSIKSSIEDKLVRSVDILPTICDFLGIECNLEKIDGVSLISNNFHSSKDLVAYIESTPLIDIKSNDVIGIRTSTSKYFRDKFSKDKRIHLYDIPTDPLEENNLVNSNPELVFELEKLLQSIINIPKLPDDGNILSSKEIEDELKKMGYV
jgi:arylsulfatase A-like enzyme